MTDDRISELFFIHYITSLSQSENEAIDIGANIGFYTLLLSGKFKKVHALEPVENNFEQLSRLLQLPIPINNISLYQKAISYRDGPTELSIGPNFATSTINTQKKEVLLWDGMAYYQQGSCLVDGITLNTFYQNKKVGFIKCDVEGGEDLIFDESCAGAALRDNLPVIALETHTDVNLVRLYDNLFQFGYRTFRTKDGRVNSLAPSELYIITPE